MIFFLRIAVLATVLLVLNFRPQAAVGGMEEERERQQVLRPGRPISMLVQDIFQGLKDQSRIAKEMLEIHIEDIPVDEREEVVRYTRSLLRRDTISAHARYILKRIATTPKEKRRTLVRHVQALVGRDKSGEDITHLLAEMSCLPCQSLDEFMNEVQPFLRGESNVYSMLSIMQHVGNIPEAVRREVLQLTETLLGAPGVDAYTRKKTLEEVQNLPAAQRQSIVEGTRLIMQGDFRSYNIRCLLRAVSDLPSDQRQDIVSHMVSFLRTRMEVYDRTFLMETIASIPSVQRASSVRAVHILRRRGMMARDLVELLRALCRVEGNREDRAHQVLRVLDRQLAHHRLSERHILVRMTRLIGDPGAVAVAMGVAHQEALSEERDLIYASYLNLLDTTPEGRKIKQFLGIEIFETALVDLRTRLRAAMAFNFLSRRETFRLQTILDGIQYVRTIRPAFRPTASSELPPFTRLVGAFYLLLKDKAAEERNAEAFVRAYLSEHFETWKPIFPDEMGAHSSAGFFLEARSSQRFIHSLSDYLEGKREVFPFLFNQRILRALKHLAQDHISDRYVFLNPMMEAVLMSMRGHCIDLNNPSEPHKKACADGVYLNFMRGFSEVPGMMGDLAAAMQAVSIVPCAMQVYAPA